MYNKSKKNRRLKIGAAIAGTALFGALTGGIGLAVAGPVLAVEVGAGLVAAGTAVGAAAGAATAGAGTGVVLGIQQAIKKSKQ